MKLVISHIGIGLREILGFPEKEEHKVVKELTNILEKTRGGVEQPHGHKMEAKNP